jgi:CelD/BcsL family acetyltransferase involved in cellulose biosynthesis
MREKKDMDDVSCMVIDSYNHIDLALEKEWDELAMQTRGSIYLTCAWSRIWWEFYGKNHLLRIFFYRCQGKLVGVIPIYIEEIRMGLVKTRVARLVGAYNPPRVFDLPIIKEYAASIGEHLARHLVGTDRCDLISIGPVSDECKAKKELFAAVEKMTNDLGIARDVPFGVYSYFDLPDTYDAYMRTLSNNERKNRRYYQKLLEKEKDVCLTVMQEPDEIEAEMPLFFALHAAQWRQQGRPGYFGAWPQSDAFNHRLAVELARLGRTRLIKISTGEKTILYEYRYIFGDYCYWQLSARAVGEQWDRFSLGATGAVVMIRSAIEEGIKRIEGGVSHYDYKTRLGAIESNVSVLRLAARRPSSIAKYHLCTVLYKLYSNFYYKLWYSRIQPRLPSVFHRPIWMIYLRMTF